MNGFKAPEIFLTIVVLQGIWWGSVYTLRRLAPDMYRVASQYTVSRVIIYMFAPVLLTGAGLMAGYDKVVAWANEK